MNIEVNFVMNKAYSVIHLEVSKQRCTFYDSVHVILMQLIVAGLVLAYDKIRENLNETIILKKIFIICGDYLLGTKVDSFAFFLFTHSFSFWPNCWRVFVVVIIYCLSLWT